ncbi:MAG: hypothetical protein AB1609_16100 [Bacillota bacterium]
MRRKRLGRGNRLAALGVLAGLGLALAWGPAAGTAFAAEPVKQRQIVYGITTWTGKEFAGTFAPANADTIYLTASTRHVLDVLETDVYYWPITQEYMADWMGYRRVIPGRLEVLRGDQVVATLDRAPYTFVYPEGYMGGEVQLAVGEEAHEAYRRYQDAINVYYDQAEAYRQAEEAWRDRMARILEEVQRTGKPADPEKLPKAPEPPEPPRLLVMQPAEGFVVQLPAGEYTLRLVGEDGKEVEAARKELEVFAPRRTGVGYQIIPESKWTMPVESGDPAEALYVSSETTFYLKAFAASELNRYAYSRMLELAKPLAGSGQRSAWQWVLGEELGGVTLQVLQGGQVVATAEPRPYYVEQTPGYALGYRIVDFDPSRPEFQGRQPSFVAFKVQLQLRAGATYELRLVDAEGKPVPNSARTVRAVRGDPAWPLYAWPGVPLVAGLVVAGWRRRLKPRRPPEA